MEGEGSAVIFCGPRAGLVSCARSERGVARRSSCPLSISGSKSLSSFAAVCEFTAYDNRVLVQARRAEKEGSTEAAGDAYVGRTYRHTKHKASQAGGEYGDRDAYASRRTCVLQARRERGQGSAEASRVGKTMGLFLSTWKLRRGLVVVSLALLRGSRHYEGNNQFVKTWRAVSYRAVDQDTEPWTRSPAAQAGRPLVRDKIT